MLVRSWNLFHGNTVPPQPREYLREMLRLATADDPDVLCVQEVPAWALGSFTVGAFPITGASIESFTSPAGNLSTAAAHSGNLGALVTIATPMPHVRLRMKGHWQPLSVGVIF